MAFSVRLSYEHAYALCTVCCRCMFRHGEDLCVIAVSGNVSGLVRTAQ
jgi:hypothetical protein